MNIKRAVFINFGPHERLEVDFSRGLCGIFGLNGRGKSTICDGIFSCLSNDFSRFAGIKEDCIRLGADPAAESSVWVEAEHDGVDFSVYRALRKTKGKPVHLLKLGGAEHVKAPEIQAKLDELLGVDRQTLSRYAFVSQFDLLGFLSQTEGERAATFQNLCGTVKAQEIHDAIGALIESETAGLGDEVLVDNSDEINRRLADAGQRIQILKSERTTAASRLLTREAADYCRDAAQRREAHRLATEELAVLEPVLQSRKRDAAAAEAAVSRRQKLFDEAQALVDTLRPQAETARGRLEALARYNVSESRRHSLQERLSQLRQSLAGRGSVALHPEAADRQLHVEHRARLKADYDRSLKIVRTFTETGLAECPTCGTPSRGIDVEKHQQVVETARGEIEQLTRRIEAIDGLQQAYNAQVSWKAAQDKLIAGIEGELASLSSGEFEPFDEAEARLTLEDLKQQEQVLSQARNLLGESAGALRGVEGRLAADLEQKAGLLKKQAEKVVDERDYRESVKSLETHDQARAAVAGLDGRLQEIAASVAADQQALKSLTVRLERGQRTRNFLARVKLLRDEVFHRTRLPQAVARANLREMEHDVNQALEGFGSPYWCQTNDDLSFTVHRPGLPGMAAQKLSGGMKAVLAIAFRTSLSSLFGNLDFLSLDEPTSGLDSQNVEYLAEALLAYANKIRGRRQVIVISHSEAIRRAFDKIIEID